MKSLSDVLIDYWHPVSWASELSTEPMATALLDERVVLWRDADGVARAARDQCPHRGTALSLGSVDESGCLVCPYHGWTYDSSGACAHLPQFADDSRIPKTAHLTMFLCEEKYGIIWACIGTPIDDIAAFPEWEDSSYRHVACPAYTWQTSAARMVENFTDFGHLGYLHDGLLGTRDDLVVPKHRVEQVGHALHYELTMAVPNTNDEFAVTDITGERGLQTNTYVLTLPYTIYLQSRYHDNDTNRTLFFASQPHGDGTSTGYCYQSRDFELDAADQPFADFQELLAEQDRPIVESQLPIDVPLSPQGELHLSFDRVAIAYRRGLSGLITKESDVELETSN